MAKSLRSKWKRKCRAIKRVRYGKKELERLKKTLGLDGTQGESTGDSKLDISSIAHVTAAEDIKVNEIKDEHLDDMEVDKKETKYNSKSLRDKNGAYPIWLHPRKIQRKGKKQKKNKVKKGKISKNKK